MEWATVTEATTARKDAKCEEEIAAEEGGSNGVGRIKAKTYLDERIRGIEILGEQKDEVNS